MISTLDRFHTDILTPKRTNMETLSTFRQVPADAAAQQQLFLGIEKRKAELFNFYQTGIVTRKVLLNYSKNLLSKFK